MTKTAIILGVVAIAIALFLVFFGAKGTPGPIVDPVCDEGYQLVGEGCMPNSEACELQGDNYYYDAILNECRMR